MYLDERHESISAESLIRLIEDNKATKIIHIYRIMICFNASFLYV
jgi:hypothetical protein